MLIGFLISFTKKALLQYSEYAIWITTDGFATEHPAGIPYRFWERYMLGKH